MDEVAALAFVHLMLTRKLTAVQILETSRLALRKVTVDDAAFILQLINEPAWLRFIGDRGVRTLEAARAHIGKNFVEKYEQHGFGLWLSEQKTDGVPIGICGLIKREALPDIDLGFAFLSSYWKKGYASEAATATLSYASEVLGIGRIVAIVSPENEDSNGC